MTTTTTHWLPTSTNAFDDDAPMALCLGTGRFLRSVLVPALIGAGFQPILIQTRGRTFLEYMQQRQEQQERGASNVYEVDIVLPDGKVVTEHVPCVGAFSLGSQNDKQAALEWIAQQAKSISILGIGVTEAGLSSKDTQVMKDLYKVLQLLEKNNQPFSKSSDKLCIINTDNVPNNGSLIQQYMLDMAKEKNQPHMDAYLNTKASFLNSMVDRITSQRQGSQGMVPKCEPIPAKALVLLDENNDLALSTEFQKQPGVKIRTTYQQLDADIALKLRVANGTHTAVAHALALLQYFQTDVLSTNDPGKLCMKYLDSLVEHQIIPAAEASQSITCTKEEAVATWQDWRQRLVHPHFGLSSFFITQNGTAKGGIRWGPTVTDLILSGKPTTAAMAFAYAVLLRWLTPIPGSETKQDVSRGWLDGFDPNTVASNVKDNNGNRDDVVEYADGLKYCTKQGWYEFKCPLDVNNPQDPEADSMMIPLTVLLRESVGQRPNKCVVAIRAYLLAKDGGNLSAEVASQPEFESLVHAIAAFYSRLVQITGSKVLMEILKELDSKSVGGLIGFDSPCASMMDYFMYLSGL